MDTTKTVNHVSLCAGYGGIDLGLKRAIPSLRTVAFSEIEAFAVANLVAKMEAGLLDEAPIWTDLKTFPWEKFSGCVDILSGGYPCQPFSHAGSRKGADDPRHLWPHIARGIRILRPTLCFFENVEGHITLGLRDVLEDLGSMGYRTAWGIFSAAEVGAPQQRKRVFILAVAEPDCLGIEELDWWRELASQYDPAWHFGRHVWPSRPGDPQNEWEPPRVLADSDRQRQSQSQGGECTVGGRTVNSSEILVNPEGDRYGVGGEIRNVREADGRQDGGLPPITCGSSDSKLVNVQPVCEPRAIKEPERPDVWCAEHEKRQAQSSLGGNADGVADWMDNAELHTSTDSRIDELRLLGNGVVPATAERAFHVLRAELNEAWK